MLLKLWKYFNGYVQIKVKGFSRDRFINLLALNNIFAWDIESMGSFITLKLSIRGFRKIKPILKKTNCSFKIISKNGYPFVSYKYRKRKFFALGLISFFAILITLSQFIWLIDINGNVNVSDTELLKFCVDRHINIGTLKAGINIQQLKKEIIDNFPQISWVNVTNYGTRLVIDVAENVKNTEILDYSTPCDIISIRDCVITDIITQNGTPAISIGNTVKKGDILINGAFNIIDENGNTAPFSPVHAIGKVRGKWYSTLSFNVPYEYEKKQYTGKKQSLYSIKIFNKKFDTNFLKNDTKFKKCDKIFKSKQLGFSPDFPLPIVIYKTTFIEYINQQETYSKQQAEKYALKLIKSKIINDFSDSCEILDKKINFYHKDNMLVVNGEFLLDDYIGIEKTPVTIQGGNTVNGTSEGTDR